MRVSRLDSALLQSERITAANMTEREKERERERERERGGKRKRGRERERERERERDIKKEFVYMCVRQKGKESAAEKNCPSRRLDSSRRQAREGVPGCQALNSYGETLQGNPAVHRMTRNVAAICFQTRRPLWTGRSVC